MALSQAEVDASQIGDVLQLEGDVSDLLSSYLQPESKATNSAASENHL